MKRTPDNFSHSLESLNLGLQYGEMHALISNNPSEISRLWDSLCFCQENEKLHSEMFGLSDVARPCNVRDEVFLLAPLFPTLSVLENIFLFETSLYNQNKFLLKSKFRNLLQEYNISISVNAMPLNLNHEQNLLLSLLRIYIHQPSIVFIPEGLDRFLDYQYATTFEKLCSSIKSNGTSIVFLTSQYELAMLYSDRVSILRNTQIISTSITASIKRYPYDFMNLFMGWEHMGNQIGNPDIAFISMAPDMKDIAFFNTNFKNALQLICSDILDITHSCACQLLLTDKNFKIHKTSTSVKNHISPTVSEEMAARLLEHESLHPFILDQTDTRTLNGDIPSSNCFVCVPIKTGLGVNTLVLIEYKHLVQLDDRMKELLLSFAKKISISIEMSVLIGRSSLVQESHHRIKNSLQTIVSLVTLEKEKLIERGFPDEVSVLTAMISRIKTIAAVHDLLSHHTAGNNLIDLASILNRISESYKNVAVLNFTLGNIIIPYNKALSISLVINELLTNSVKHSGTKSGKLMITVECCLRDTLIYISVTDNGIGFPKDYETAAHNGIGYSIIQNIVESLSGKILYSYDNGAKAEITFPQETVYLI